MAVENTIASPTTAQQGAVLADFGVACGKVNTYTEAAEEPDVVARYRLQCDGVI